MRLIRRVVFAILLAIIVFLGVIRPQIIALTSTGHARELYDVACQESTSASISSRPRPARRGISKPGGSRMMRTTFLFAIPGASALPAPPSDTIEV